LVPTPETPLRLGKANANINQWHTPDAGFEYQLGFDLPEDDDKQFQIGEETVLMKPGHALYLLGMEIDWATGLNNRGFTFNNPNATETCGCGTSFSA